MGFVKVTSGIAHGNRNCGRLSLILPAGGMLRAHPTGPKFALCFLCLSGCLHLSRV